MKSKYYCTNVDLIKTYKLRIYDMFHFRGSRVRWTRCGIQINFLGGRVPSFETFLTRFLLACGNSKVNLKPNEEKTTLRE